MIAVEYDTVVPAVSGVCPSGYVAHDMQAVCGVDNGACWITEQLRSLCAAGITYLKTSSGVDVPIYADKVTSPALHIGYNDSVCYVDLAQGRATNAINVKYGNVIYHTVP